YKGRFTVDPFLTGHGIYPYAHGAGEGKLGDAIATAYYHLMGGIDGQTDLLEIADNAKLPIKAFDYARRDFLLVGFMHHQPQLRRSARRRWAPRNKKIGAVWCPASSPCIGPSSDRALPRSSPFCRKRCLCRSAPFPRGYAAVVGLCPRSGTLPKR